MVKENERKNFFDLSSWRRWNLEGEDLRWKWPFYPHLFMQIITMPHTKIKAKMAYFFPNKYHGDEVLIQKTSIPSTLRRKTGVKKLGEKYSNAPTKLFKRQKCNNNWHNTPPNYQILKWRKNEGWDIIVQLRDLLSLHSLRKWWTLDEFVNYANI